MDYQAAKFARALDPNWDLLLSKAMDLTNLGRNAQNLVQAAYRATRHQADTDPGAAHLVKGSTTM
ncbi:hypothetical protein PR003_g9538 [Phytophthora rubi]|uniref:Uncharacterized protein n=1 Tax=Phytophthora rubi TaxID=129364 RepID=A0A6A4FG20_9STRA|nr:hypothetical protein PR003_g9538 [Phytophthora rubi]